MSDGAPDAPSGAGSDPRRDPYGKPHRLRRRPDFLAAAGGKRFHTERLTAQARLREPGEQRDGAPAEGLHLGFTITKRVGHATERNRIRRRLRRALEEAAHETAACPADVVVIARRPALDAPFTSLVEDLRKALSVVTKPRKARLGEPAPGAARREGAHVPRRGRARPPARTDSRQSPPHGPTDG